jgi:hypothetical protein
LKGLWESDHCFFCGSCSWLERHHIFPGGFRHASEEYGFVVTLCHYCHNEPGGVHFNKEKRNELKRMAQREYEKKRTRTNFMRDFGRNYLEEEE